MIAIIMLLGFIAIIALPSVAWLYSLADVITNEFETLAIKVVWAVVLCLFPPLGTVLYLLVGRNQRTTFRPVGRVLFIWIFVLPALLVVLYLLYSLGHLTFMPEPPGSIQI